MGPPQFNTKDVFSAELTRVLNWGVFDVKLRGVLNWEVFAVKLWGVELRRFFCVELRDFDAELRDFGCLKGVVVVLNWGVCVELRDALFVSRI